MKIASHLGMVEQSKKSPATSSTCSSREYRRGGRVDVESDTSEWERQLHVKTQPVGLFDSLFVVPVPANDFRVRDFEPRQIMRLTRHTGYTERMSALRFYS